MSHGNVGLESLQHQDHKLIQRLLTCLDGEKDPRNLMIIFSILNVVMVEWDISSDAQVREYLEL